MLTSTDSSSITASTIENSPKSEIDRKRE